MRKCKRSFVALCCGIFLIAGNAHAQWPVFDFTETVPMGKDIKEGYSNLKNLKKQLLKGSETLSAIGKGTKSIALFNKSARATNKEDVSSSSASTQKSSENTKNTTKETTDTTAKITGETTSAQQELTNDYVKQVEQVLNIETKTLTISPIDTKTAKKVEDSYIEQDKQIQDFKSNFINYETLNKKVQVIDSPLIADDSIIIEEEEEEEEIDSDAMQEEIIALQKLTLDEQKKLADTLNDVLETQLTTLHNSTKKNLADLNNLNSSIQNMEKISAKDKQEFRQKISEISQKQRTVSDRGIQIIESARDNYNKEYNRTIKDGINNYTKVVLAYTKGVADKNAVIAAGKKLRSDVQKINVTPDKGVLKELHQAAADVHVEIENLGKEVNNLLQKIEKIS